MPKQPSKQKLTSKQRKFLAVLDWVKNLDPGMRKVTIELLGESATVTKNNWGDLDYFVSRVSENLGKELIAGTLLIFYKPPKTTLTIICGFMAEDDEWFIFDPEIMRKHIKWNPGVVFVNAAEAYPKCPIPRTKLLADRPD